MRAKKKAQPLSEQDIDQIVVAQAEDDAAWGKPVQVRSPKTASSRCRLHLPRASRFLHVCTASRAWRRGSSGSFKNDLI